MDDRVVAIVDDNIAILDAVKFVLEIWGFKVLTYPSPAVFLDDVAARPACLIVDQNMPEMTGLELVAELRRNGNTIPVLLTTGLLSSDIVANAERLRIETVMEKPAEPEELLKFLNAHC